MPDGSKSGTLQAIGESTPVRLGLVIGVFSLTVGAIIWASDMNAKLQILQSSMVRVEATIESASGDRWRKSDHDTFAAVMERRVTEIEKIAKDNQLQVLELKVRSKQP